MSVPADGTDNRRLSWVILTRGDRPAQLLEAVTSLRGAGSPDIVIVGNGVDAATIEPIEGARVITTDENVGVPAGRNLGLQSTTGDLVGFLDDDARLLDAQALSAVADQFAADARLGAVSFRLVDEIGASAARHVPRPGGGGVEADGQVVNFLGGACLVRRAAFEAAGEYWGDLFYAHEEVELAWRLYDAGYHVRYTPAVEVFHPRTEISRHEAGWFLTGRNRVMIARRTLPWPVALVHVTLWLVAGTARAPGSACRRSYLGGWFAGWRSEVDRRPIAWGTVRDLAAAGRPPVV